MSKIDYYDESALTPYRKKSHKKVKKSNHKHYYEPCLIRFDNHIVYGTHCSICGKIGDIKLFESEPSETRPHVYRLLKDEEIIQKYKNLDIYDYKTLEKIDSPGK